MKNQLLISKKLRSYLDDARIAYEVDVNLVRGLDYYNHTAFEIMSTSDGFGAITTFAVAEDTMDLQKKSAAHQRRE